MTQSTMDCGGVNERETCQCATYSGPPAVRRIHTLHKFNFVVIWGKFGEWNFARQC